LLAASPIASDCGGEFNLRERDAMSHLVPDHDDLILLERDTLVGGIRVRAEQLDAFADALDNDLAELVERWQPLAAPRAMLSDRRVSQWR
jgi:hypothetical protein